MNPGGQEGGFARLLVVISGAPATPHLCVVLILVGTVLYKNLDSCTVGGGWTDHANRWWIGGEGLEEDVRDREITLSNGRKRIVE